MAAQLFRCLRTPWLVLRKALRANCKTLIAKCSSTVRIAKINQQLAILNCQVFLRRSFRMASSASMMSSRVARLLANDSFKLNALVGGRNAKT